VIVLGVDPGTASTGYGVVRSRGADYAALDGGVISTSSDLPLERRLTEIHSRLRELIREYNPDAVAVEDLFFGENVRSAFAVGQARGVAVLAAGQAGLPCFHYTPQAVKSSVCGSGGAGKQQVQRMVQMLLRLAEPPMPDHAADALAVAICHAGRKPAAAGARVEVLA
jgi:crossover junction endodeoxyribonuclease RuvC